MSIGGEVTGCSTIGCGRQAYHAGECGKPLDAAYRPPRLRRVEIVQVVRVVTCEGKGTHDDPAREVTTYWGMGGDLLATNDPMREEPY